MLREISSISLLFFYFLFFFFFFLAAHVTCGILVPRPGSEPVASALRALSLDHWTIREVSFSPFLKNRGLPWWSSG